VKGTVKMKFTVFTPTFNRKNLLEKLYKSLQNQTFRDFEWLIVDDGSTDGTDEKVKEFINENKLNIRYFYTENGGKQRAYNFAVQKAEGELFICLDSDDEYINKGLEIILKYWEQFRYIQMIDISENNDIEILRNLKEEHNDGENFSVKEEKTFEEIVKSEKRDEILENFEYGIAGMGYLSTYPDGKVIGTVFPENEMISTQFDIYNKYGVKGDKGLMFRTEILKKYPFPVFDGEKFITEAVVYNRICQKYKMLFINEKIEIKEYQKDGLTSKYNNLLLKNPKGHALYHNERNKYKMSFKNRILNNAIYYKFCKVAGYSFSKIYGECYDKLSLLTALPVGIYMWRKVKKNEEIR